MNTLGLRGFAQVIPQQGNIYAMSRLAEQKRQADRDYQLKREEQFGRVFEDFSKGLALEKMRPELMSAQQELFKQTYESGSKAYEHGMKTGDFNSSRQFLNEAKLNYDQFKGGLMSIDDTVGQVQKLVMENKDKVFDPKQFGKKWTEISDRLFIRDNGKIVGFDKEAMGDLNSILDSPDIYNKQNRIKSFIGNLADKQISKIRETGNYAQVSSVKTKEGIFQFDKNGNVKTDKNGIPVVNVTPQFVQDFVSDDVNRAWAMEAASEVAPFGENPEKYLKEGVEKLIQNHVPYSEEIKSRSYKPEWMTKLGKDKEGEILATRAVEGIFDNDPAAFELFNSLGKGIEVRPRTETPGDQIARESNGLPVPISEMWDRQDKRYVDVFKKVLVKDERGSLIEDVIRDRMLKDGSKLIREGNREYIEVPMDTYDLSDRESTTVGLTKLLTESGMFDKDLAPKIYKKLKEQNTGKYNDY